MDVPYALAAACCPTTLLDYATCHAARLHHAALGKMTMPLLATCLDEL